MKEIQGRLKNKNKPRSSLGTVENKQKPDAALQALTWICYFL